MTDEHHERVYIDHQAATTLSEVMKILQAKDPMSANAEFEFTAKMLTDKIVIH